MLAHIDKVLSGIRMGDTSVWCQHRSYPAGWFADHLCFGVDAGLFYIFGLSTSGMINGPIAGRVIAALMTGRNRRPTSCPSPSPDLEVVENQASRDRLKSDARHTPSLKLHDMDTYDDPASLRVIRPPQPNHLKT